jgi:hypothetical protein
VTRFKTNPWTLGELLTLLDSSRVVLPEFQRDFVWWPKDIDLLLTSLVQDFPAGSLLFLKTDAHATLAWRSVAGVQQADANTAPDYLVLDGQQRLTSLSLALNGRGDHLFFMDLKRLEDDDLDEGIYYLRRKDAEKKGLLAREVQFERHTYPLGSIFGTDADEYWFEDYAAHHASQGQELADIRDRVRGLKESFVDPLKKYSFPVVELPAETSLEAVCTIFETLNKTGMKLTVFDLLTAKFWPRGLHLRDLYEGARDTWMLLGPDGLDIEATYLLQAISLVRSEDVPKCKRSDLLDLNPEGFAHDWERVCHAASVSLTMLRDECGVLSRTWLPYAALLPALFAAAVRARDFSGPQQATAWEKLRRWFWCCCFGQRYEGPVNTLNAADFRALLLWFDDDEKVPEAVRDFSLDGLDLTAVRRQRAALYRSVICLTIVNGARDFHTGKRITPDLLNDPDLHIEDHHVVPTGYLKKLDPAQAGEDSILNRCLIDGITNKVISDRPPAAYLKDIAKVMGEETLGQILRSHLLPSDPASSLRHDPIDVDRFRRERFALLAPAIAAATGAHLPMSEGDAYLNPERPFSNELALKRVVRGLRGDVLWYEQHMDRKLLEVLIDDLEREAVTRIRLLSGPANITPKVQRAFDRFRQEMAGSAIECEWRVLPADDAREMHARVLYDSTTTYELPPVNVLLMGTVDSIRKSDIPHRPFEEAWAGDAARPVDEVQVVPKPA